MIEGKLPLKFKNGRFRMLIISDLHYRPGEDGRTIKALTKLIDTAKPDFIFMNGDITGGRSEKEEFVSLLSDVASPIEQRNIPWAHVFGNHDESPGLEKVYQQSVFERYPHCVSMAGPEKLPGVGNYFLPVYDKDGNVVFGFWAFDSMQDFKTQSAPVAYGFEPYFDLLMPSRIASSSDSDYLRFEQVMWYYTESQKLEKEFGRKIPSEPHQFGRHRLLDRRRGCCGRHR